MPEIAELEHRITAALARIGAGVDRLAAGSTTAAGHSADPGQMADLAELQAQLATERAAHAAADDAFNQMRMPMAGDQTADVDRLTRQLDAQGLDNQRLRSSLAQLREELRRLREAAVQGLADAPLVNRALQAELDSLRTVRASETAEMADILSALGPIVDAEEARSHA